MSTTSTHILIVDDERAICESIANFFDDFGYETSIAESGEQGLELVSQHPFEIGIIDLRLPGIDGDTFIQQAHKIQNRMHFLIYTGSVDYQLTPPLRTLGMTDAHIFQKPLKDINILLNAVQELL